MLGWAGMRGAITLAALLAVPKTTQAGAPLAGRNDIIYLGFAVIMATLVGQGMTLPWIVRRFASLKARRWLTPNGGPNRTGSGSAGPNRRRPAQTVSSRRSSQTVCGLSTSVACAPFRHHTKTKPRGGRRAAAAAQMALRRDLIALQRQSLLALREPRAVSG